jgi:NAD(P)-dependent dehydrogenase (short-subunit alcohol dehydrogenase family)
VDLGLEEKRALITGSTAGIGFATARSLARERAEVTINGRTQHRVDEALERLKQGLPGARIEGIAADLSNAKGCKSITEKLPEVDILINNLGVYEPKPFEQITDEDWLRIFETNVLSGTRLSRHYITGMRARNWGRIVFVSSESALQIPPEMVHYGMTKTAQLAISRGLAETLAGSGVTVNCVLPGPTSSEGVGEFVEQMAVERGINAHAVEQDFFRNMRPSSLLQRFATPDEVAAMIAYVCSVQASATTGAALRVDGGVVRAIT